MKAATEALSLLKNKVTSLTITWIPAHKGHFGNEKADKLAKAGAAATDHAHKLTTTRPHSQIKTNIRSNILETWAAEWKEDPSARHTKEFYATPSPQKAKYVYKLARLELGRFVRLISGHNNLNHFQTKIGLSNNGSCRLCEEACLLYTSPSPRDS